jgi:hypothetical protein
VIPIETVRPWYTHFWLWFIILLPASVVVASIITVIIAFQNADSLVADNYYKDGLAINQVIARDKAAAQLRLTANLEIDELVGELRVSIKGNLSEHTDVLQMAWFHPTKKKRDFTLTLRNTVAGEYVGQLESEVSGRWYLEISGMIPQPWRLKAEVDLNKHSRINFGQSNASDLSGVDNSGGT